MWSASSRTVTSTEPRSTWPCWIRSSRRPGQASTMSTPWRMAWTWGCWPTPPKTVRVRSPCTAASGARAASICATSSRVGARISARGRFGVRREPEAESRATIGSRNARVLPEPVRPRPRTSRPDRESGSVAAWIGVGSVMPAEASTSERSAGTPSSRKEEDKGSFANCVSVSPQSRRRLSPRRSGVVEHCPVRYECCNTHQDRGKTERSLCPNRRAQRAKPSHCADVTYRSGASGMAQRKADSPVSAWPITSWCTSVVPS